MKTNFLKAFVLSIAVLSASCSSDESDGGSNVPNLEGSVLQGNITTDLNIPTGTYSLKGVVTVKNGATLTIQEGTTFVVSTADQALGNNYLQIEQGAKIMANGTATQPIVFTAESASLGAWG